MHIRLRTSKLNLRADRAIWVEEEVEECEEAEECELSDVCVLPHLQEGEMLAGEMRDWLDEDEEAAYKGREHRR